MARERKGTSGPDTSTRCSLGQSLVWFDTGALPSESALKAAYSKRSLPSSNRIREALIGAIADSEISPVGTLVTMIYDYDVDAQGRNVRHEVEIGVVAHSYVAAPDLWHIDRVDFYLSTLDLFETPQDIDRSNLPSFDEPIWLRVRDITLPLNRLKKVSPKGARSRAGVGGAPVKKDWDAFWREVVCHIYEHGTPLDDDDEWRELNKVLRKNFLNIHESYVRGKLRKLRAVLRERGHLSV